MKNNRFDFQPFAFYNMLIVNVIKSFIYSN